MVLPVIHWFMLLFLTGTLGKGTSETPTPAWFPSVPSLVAARRLASQGFHRRLQTHLHLHTSPVNDKHTNDDAANHARLACWLVLLDSMGQDVYVDQYQIAQEKLQLAQAEAPSAMHVYLSDPYINLEVPAAFGKPFHAMTLHAMPPIGTHQKYA